MFTVTASLYNLLYFYLSVETLWCLKRKIEPWWRKNEYQSFECCRALIKPFIYSWDQLTTIYFVSVWLFNGVHIPAIKFITDKVGIHYVVTYLHWYSKDSHEHGSHLPLSTRVLKLIFSVFFSISQPHLLELDHSMFGSQWRGTACWWV